MAKKTRKEKELAKLRREAEFLRAQLKGSNEGRNRQESPKPQDTDNKKVRKEEIQRVDPRYIKSDLIKAGILTAVAVGIVFAVYMLRDQIPFL